MIKKKSPQIIFIQPGYASYRKGLFDKLHENFDIFFIFMKGASPYPALGEPDIKWQFICLQSEKNPYWIFTLVKTLLTQKYDIIISSNPGDILSTTSFCMAKLLSRKHITWNLNWYDEFKFSEKGIFWKMIRRMHARFIRKKSDAIIVSGSSALKYHERICIPKNKIFVANQSVEKVNPNIKTSVSKEHLAINKKYTILFLSRILNWKGLDILIKAFNKLEKERDDIFLLIGGDGDFRSICEILSDDIGVKNIKFTGNIPRETVYEYYRLSDIFVLPSCNRGNAEAWGLVVNEAMRAGKPVITTDAVGAADDLVKNGVNGFVVLNNNVEEMYLALKRILEGGDDLIEKMGTNSLQIFNKFNDYNKMFSGFQKAINYSFSNQKSE